MRTAEEINYIIIKISLKLSTKTVLIPVMAVGYTIQNVIIMGMIEVWGQEKM
jgi:hypothetical protein